MKGEELLKALEELDADLITQAEKDPASRNIWKKVIAVAACLALVAAVAFGLTHRGAPPEQLSAEPVRTVATQPATAPVIVPDTQLPTEPAVIATGYLTIDVNPSIRFAVEDGIITECIAVNDDAEPILADLDLIGKELTEAIPMVIAALIEQGYLAQEEQAPVLLVAAYGGEQPVALLELASETAKESLEACQVNTYIVSQQVINVESVKKLAEQYGVSEGKMQYILNLLATEKNISLNGIASSTIVELFGMDIARRSIEPRYQVGEYDEYGEMVLYTSGRESMEGYIPWEELSESYKAELETLYSPEDLAILSQPREWTTVPNSVGLPEAEARALMNSRKIGVRVHYVNSLWLPNDADAKEYEPGTCIYQDASQGMRWNTDAPVTIWIYMGE